jgi:large subunit ribosomal protein L6
MSRIGKRPIELPKNVEVKTTEQQVCIKGPKGTMTFEFSDMVQIEVQDNVLLVKADYENDRRAKCLMGTTQSILQSMVRGVTEGFQKQLNLVGVGYRAAVSGKILELNLGYSHPIQFPIPETVSVKVSGTQITLESCDKQLIGQVAANIRKLRPPEPYKGKGILFVNEVIRRKAGKAGKK